MVYESVAERGSRKRREREKEAGSKWGVEASTHMREKNRGFSVRSVVDVGKGEKEKEEAC